MKVGTDFSGIGAPEMALKYLGIDFESVFACEIDKYARQSYKQLHNPKKFYKDITTRNHKEVEQLDLYVAGFPCQAFSMAGRRLGFEDTRGTLFYNVAEFIKINKPKVFVLENVKGLVSHDSGKTFQTIIDILSNNGGTQNGQIILDMFDDGLGYHIYWQVLNTKNYGIPQNRERIFIVGFKDFKDFSYPKPTKLKLKLGDMLQDNPNSKYLLSDKLIQSFTNHKERHTEKGTGFKWEVKKKDDVANCLRANASLCPTDNTIEVSKEVRTDEAKKQRKETGTNDFRDKKIEWRQQDYSNTITTSLTNDHYIKQKKIRRLTPLECWRLHQIHNYTNKLETQ
jgi:DNA (cytosine-5)-methyltransferase 1